MEKIFEQIDNLFVNGLLMALFQLLLQGLF